MSESQNLDVERAVKERYSTAAQQPVAALCCPTQYDARYLEIIPQEILERDYGCGDPSAHIKPGETVLDLGSGGGKICYIASQVVGAEGRVIGVDMNDEMLALAETHRSTIGETLGYDNVTFHKGKIQDLTLDYRALESQLAAHPVRTPADLDALERWKEEQRQTQPMIADDSIDVIVSNCVLNLVAPRHKQQLFSEMHRVLRPGGRCVISDIVSDEDVPVAMRQDPELWSGCISGAFREPDFLQAFTDAGFHGVRILERTATPWQVVEGIEFRSLTVEAFKKHEGHGLDGGDTALELNQAVVYRGPWQTVTDDAGNTLHRGERMAVDHKTFDLLTAPPYAVDIDPVEPRHAISPETAQPFDRSRNRLRHPRETKGQDYHESRSTDDPCCGGSSC